MTYTYTDFVTKKPRFTRGKFIGWERGGILNIWGAVFQRRASVIFVPVYLLAKETIEKLPEIPKE